MPNMAAVIISLRPDWDHSVEGKLDTKYQVDFWASSLIREVKTSPH